jgi:hypothetical protein
MNFVELIMLAVLVGIASPVLLMVVPRLFERLRGIVKVRRRAQEYLEVVDDEAVDVEEVDEWADGTAFQRWVLAEFRAARGVPTRTTANEILVRREIHRIIKEAREDIRGVDLEMHCNKVTAMAFIPSAENVLNSRVFGGRKTFFERIMEWLGIYKTQVSERVAELERPEA